MELIEQLKKIAIVRPNHSPSLVQVREYLKKQLGEWSVPCQIHSFNVRPYKHAIAGGFNFLMAIVYLILVLADKPLYATVPATVIFLTWLLEFETFHYPVSSIVQQTAETIEARFDCETPEQELILATHYDSKTDFFDHVQRQKIYDWFYLFLLGGILTPLLSHFFLVFSQSPGQLPRVVLIVFSVLYLAYWFLVFLAFGGYLLIGKEKQSLGVIDNGTAVVTLLTLANRLSKGDINLRRTRLKLLFFSGEEVNMQGADAYVKQRFHPSSGNSTLPTYLVNLELVGQSGPIAAWKENGVFVRFYKADSRLTQLLSDSVKKTTGQELALLGKTADDAVCFMRKGIPSVSIGNTGIPGLGEGGFHGPGDNFERLDINNLQSMIEVLTQLLKDFDKAAIESKPPNPAWDQPQSREA